MDHTFDKVNLYGKPLLGANCRHEILKSRSSAGAFIWEEVPEIASSDINVSYQFPVIPVEKFLHQQFFSYRNCSNQGVIWGRCERVRSIGPVMWPRNVT